MILGVPGDRRGYWKVTGSVVDEAFRRGHRVSAIMSNQPKAGEAVSADEIRSVWPQMEFGVYPDVIIGDPSVGDMALPPVPTIALDFVWEQRIHAHKTNVLRCWSTDYHRAAFRNVPGQPVTGMTALDAFSLVDDADTRERFGLDDKPVVVLLTAKLGIRSLWRRTLFKHLYYPSILYAIRDYCRKHGALFVVKTREKHKDTALVLNLADRVIDDQLLWPYSAARIINVASLVIHFQSGAVHEASAAGVPQISIRIPRPDVSWYRGFDVLCSGAPYTLHHWPGVVQTATHHSVGRMLAENEVTTVQPKQLVEFNARFNGLVDGKNGARVMDLVEGYR